jgi:hypothetical protein
MGTEQTTTIRDRRERELRVRARSRFDTAGGITAGVCAVHCLLTPVIIAFGGLGAVGALVSERMEVGFVAMSLVIGLASLGPAFVRTHRDPMPLVYLAVGFIVLAITRIFDAPVNVERCIVPACAGLLITAHARNHRSCKRCAECDRQGVLRTSGNAREM